MSFGLKVILPNGRTYDSSLEGASFVDSIDVPSGSTGSRSYPHLKGFKVFGIPFATNPTAFGKLKVTVTYSGGIPILTWTRHPIPSQYWNNTSVILVYAK